MVGQADIPSPTVGLVIEDRYELKREIASGAMGTVWLAERLELGGKVAIKFASHLSESARERFLQEARIVAQLSSAHVVRVFDYGAWEQIPYLVMEHLEGETLRERLLAEGRLSTSLVVDLVKQTANAVGEAHQAGVIHRDLKPANIFLTGSSRDPVVKVLDFGVARTIDSGVTGEGEIIGTPSYLSPEQAKDSRKVDGRSDMWSLAIVAYECLTGTRPFVADTGPLLIEAILEQTPPRPSHVADVPSGFDEWFWKATAKRPEDRFESAAEFVDALRRALGDKSLRPGERSGDTLRRGTDETVIATEAGGVTNDRRGVLFGWIVGAAALIVAGLVVIWNSGREDKLDSPVHPRESAAGRSEPDEPRKGAQPTLGPSAQTPPEAPAPSGLSPPEPSQHYKELQDEPVPAPGPSPAAIRRPQPPQPKREVVRPPAPEPPPVVESLEETEEDLWGERL